MKNNIDKKDHRINELYTKSMNLLYRRTNKLFAILLIIQWIFGIIVALWISPKTWAGVYSQPHIHVWAAIFLGGAIIIFPLALIIKKPGAPITRHAIAVAQTLYSALLIHLTGGRIETHFHVFGSLAFLSFYRDWKVLITASVVVTVDHFLRGLYFPQSVYGILVVEPWRWLEHAGWVVFEDIFLIISILQSKKEMISIAIKQIELEVVNKKIEDKIKERTKELQFSNEELIKLNKVMIGREERIIELKNEVKKLHEELPNH